MLGMSLGLGRGCSLEVNMGGRSMAISSDEELARAVAEAGELIQMIQDYCDRTIRYDSKIRFPAD
jgi:hypothetical protein